MVPVSRLFQFPSRIKAQLALGVWRITPPCREVVRLTSAEHDRSLPRGVVFRLFLHRRFCPWCARYAQQIQFLTRATRQLDEHVEELAGTALEPAVKERIKQALREAGQSPETLVL